MPALALVIPGNMVAVPIEKVFPRSGTQPMEADLHGPQGPPQASHDPQGSPPASSGTSTAMGLLRRARTLGVRATQAEVERHVVPAMQWFFQQSLGGSTDVPQARCASAAAWIAGQVTRAGRFSTPFVVPPARVQQHPRPAHITGEFSLRGLGVTTRGATTQGQIAQAMVMAAGGPDNGFQRRAAVDSHLSTYV